MIDNTLAAEAWMMHRKYSNDDDLTCIRRTAIIVWHLAHGESMSVPDIMRLTGLTWAGDSNQMRAVTQVLPVRHVGGVYEVVVMGEIDD